jgi:hypothetical protein
MRANTCRYLEANLLCTAAPHLRCSPWGFKSGEVWVEVKDDLGGMRVVAGKPNWDLLATIAPR